jgi:hypothetical protein
LLNKLSIFTASLVILASVAGSVEAFPKCRAAKPQHAPKPVASCTTGCGTSDPAPAATHGTPAATPLVAKPVIAIPSINVAPQTNLNVATNVVNQIGIAVGVGVPAIVGPQKVDLGNTQKIK